MSSRAFIKDVEKVRPSAILDIIHSGELMCMGVRETVKERLPVQGKCSREGGKVGERS